MHSYIEPLVKLFKPNANSANAEPMAKYMKNLFPYLGIKTPKRKEPKQSKDYQNIVINLLLCLELLSQIVL